MDAVLAAFVKYVLPLLGTALVAFLTKLLNTVVDNYAAEKQAQGNLHHANMVAKYIELGKGSVLDIMNALEQTIVQGLKDATADGKLTVEDGAAVKQQAIDTFNNMASEEVKSAIQTVYGDIDSFLSTYIEAQVKAIGK